MAFPLSHDEGSVDETMLMASLALWQLPTKQRILSFWFILDVGLEANSHLPTVTQIGR